jgi:hypothetical protein
MHFQARHGGRRSCRAAVVNGGCAGLGVEVAGPGRRRAVLPPVTTADRGS